MTKPKAQVAEEIVSDTADMVIHWRMLADAHLTFARNAYHPKTIKIHEAHAERLTRLADQLEQSDNSSLPPTTVDMRGQHVHQCTVEEYIKLKATPNAKKTKAKATASNP